MLRKIGKFSFQNQEDRHCTDGHTKNCLPSQKNSFPSSNNVTNQQGPEEKACKSLSRMKLHHQEGLDPDRISFGIARLKFTKVIFGNSKGTDDNKDKLINYYIDLSFFSVT